MLTKLAQNQSQLGSNGAMKSQTRATATARMLVDAYCTAVQEQGVITLSAIPELTDYQNTAKIHANNWTTSVAPQLIQTNTDLLDFAHNFDSFYNPLVTLAQNIDSGTNKETFIKGLGLLVTKIQQKEVNAQKALTALTGFRSDVLSDQSNFKAALAKGDSVYAGDQGEIAQLRSQDASLNDTMNKDTMLIGFGSTGMVVGGLMIAVGVLGEIETAGVSTALIVAGVAMVAGGTAAMIAGAVDYSKQLDLYKANVAKIAADSAEMSALSVMHDQIEALVTASESAVTALNTMVTTWQLLGTQFEAVITQLNDNTNPDDGLFLVSDLETAKADWDDLAGTAQLINTQCSTLPVQQSTPAAALLFR